MKTLLTVLLTLSVAVPIAWYAGRSRNLNPSNAESSTGSSGERKLLYYQSAMHPWVRSEKPGRCTICGMELTAVYESESGINSTAGDVVHLTPSMIQLVGIQTAEVQEQPVHRTLSVSGTIDDDATRHRVISAYSSGRIERLHVNFVGAEVRESEPLIDFYSPDLLQAEREYRSLTGDLRSAAATRLIQLGLTPQQIEQLPAKSPDLITSQILAPMSGSVVLQNVYEGQTLQAGQALFEIADFSTMWFQFHVYEQDLPWIRPGLSVDVTPDSHPGTPFTGTISFINPNIDPTTRSTLARVELKNPAAESGHRLLHRSFARGRVHLSPLTALAVPRTAVIDTGAGPVAYVDLGGGGYVRREIKLGRKGDRVVQVLSGLEAGELVVVNGNLLLDGQAEMNRTFVTPAAKEEVTQANPAVPNPPAFPKLTAEQIDPVRAFLTAADMAGDLLASDDLPGFLGAAPKVKLASDQLLRVFPADDPWRALALVAQEKSDFPAAADLKAARRQFHPFSQAAVSMALALRRAEKDFSELKVFRCPMTKDAFEGAPRRAEWIQLKASVRNPYFGAEMLDCGAEVKP